MVAVKAAFGTDRRVTGGLAVAVEPTTPPQFHHPERARQAKATAAARAQPMSTGSCEQRAAVAVQVAQAQALLPTQPRAVPVAPVCSHLSPARPLGMPVAVAVVELQPHRLRVEVVLVEMVELPTVTAHRVQPTQGVAVAAVAFQA